MSNKAPWFRMFGDRWQSETRALTLQERAIYIDLLIEMHRREEPLSDDWLKQVCSIIRARPTTFFPAIERLVALGLFVRVDAGLWSEFMEGEIENRGRRTERARYNSAKSRCNTETSCSNSAENMKNLPQKSEQNQRAGAAIEIQSKIYREAPVGASPYVDTEREFVSSSGPPPANAGRSMSAIDEANLELEEIMRADYAALHEGRLAYDLEDVCGCNEEDYLGDDDDDDIGDEDVADVMDHEHAWILEAWDEGRGDAERQSRGGNQ